ncbi:MAG TPA: hypothetical protein PKJ63_12760 [Cyclobacteriaceae bacterium]|nr:hypothetical protein [Cyclobacteriaceae bacterium]HRW98765.1 hypothetical protein [Cyclobacteriaceae bacterium]
MVIKSYIASRMKVPVEIYRGIEYVQISKLPQPQREIILQSLPADQIIKILTDKELLNDCVQYKHYESWYIQHWKDRTVSIKALEPSVKLAND